MESWTRHGESMPVVVCEVKISDRFSQNSESNTARERIHTVVWQKTATIKVFQASDLGSEARPQMEISSTIWDVKCVMGQWLITMI